MAGGVQLKRQLTLLHGVAIICGMVIGSGIYVAPKGVLNGTMSVGLSLIIWVAGGVLATMGALSFAELGTTFPASGEKYHYLEQSYGPFVAFLYLWMYLFMFRPGANAIKCIVFATYVLKPVYSDCPVPQAAVMLIGICLACILTAVNCANVKWAARGQSFFTTVGILALLLISITGIVYMCLGATDNFKNAFQGSTTDLGDISLACYSGIFAYWGCITA